MPSALESAVPACVAASCLLEAVRNPAAPKAGQSSDRVRFLCLGWMDEIVVKVLCTCMEDIAETNLECSSELSGLRALVWLIIVSRSSLEARKIQDFQSQ